MSFETLLRELHLAFRNIVRQRRRSSLALAIIAGGVIAMILAGGFVQWIFDSMREGTIRSQLGHIQIVRPGFYEKGLANPYAYLLKQDDPVFKQISETPGVLTVAPRLIFSGLVSHGDSTISFAGDGIDPAKEKELSTYVQIVDGQPLSPDDPTGIIIGQGLAANLGVSTGDTIVLLAATQKGSLNAVECKVRGLFVTAAKAYDDAFLRAPLQVAQKLARTKGVTSWLVLLSETDHTDAFLNTIKAQVSRDDLEFIPWHALADFYNKTVALMSRQVGSIEILIAFIIILSISNTLSMTVMERIGEIGTIMALGVKANSVLRLFLLEGLLLGILGGAIGMIIGGAAGSIISYFGIPMPPPPGMTTGVTGRIHIQPHLLFEAATLAISTTLIASILPALKASRMNIVDALRHQR